MAELIRLNNKRSSIKGRITIFKKYIDLLASFEKMPTLEIGKLTLKLSKFEALFSEFDSLQDEIEQLNSDNLTLELSERDQIEQSFYHCIATAQAIIRESTSLEEVADVSNVTVQQCNNHDDQESLGFRLPTIQIPKFDGSYYKWLEFRDTFNSLVHSNSKVNDIHKFHYLNSYLEGDAARVISNFEVTSDNYAEAWKILCDRYNNKRQLVNNHLKSLFNIQPSTRESERALRFIIDHVTKNLRALNTLGQPTLQWDTLIIFMVTAKLDSNTSIKWEEHRNLLSDLPTLNEFLNFLRNRADVLETVQRNKQDKDRHASENNNIPFRHKSQSSFIVSQERLPSQPLQCVICKGSHRIFDCNSFKNKSPEERLTQAIGLKLCHNCLRPGHHTRQCRLNGTCRICKRRHNTFLHQNNIQNTTTEVTGENNVTPSQSESVSLTATSSSETLLCTALVDLINPNTTAVTTVRALLDSGSQSSFITESLKSKLNLTSQHSDTHSIIGIGNTKLSLNSERCVVQLKSKNDSFNVLLSCLVLPHISDGLPKTHINIKHLDLSNFQLADPTFNVPSEIQMLIGADLFWDLIGSKQHSLGPNNPILRSSKLGWLISGPIIQNNSNKNSTFCNFAISNAELHDELTKFWELETFYKNQPHLSEEEKLCEQHFIANTERLPNGQFSVKLPLVDSPDCLGDSYPMAKKRFLNLENRFNKQPEVKKMYTEFIHEYAELGHLTEIDTKNIGDTYFYLPHHPVIREKSETTRLRTVFDASAKSTSGLSINDLQMTGPNIQDSLFSILIRFRQYKYALSGDIEKMYRAVSLHQSDRDLQLILWRDSEDKPLQTLQLNTVTYGFSSASFLSTRCLWQVGEECENKFIKNIIQHDFYVDDLLTGSDSEKELSDIKDSVSEALAKGGFHLRKFRSNSSNLLPHDSKNKNFMISSTDSTLGLGWDTSSDQLNFPFKVASIDVDNSIVTKRSILSASLKTFDPLGLLSLFTIIPRILIQQLWSLKIDWDMPVPEDIKKAWKTFIDNFKYFEMLKLPRQVLCNNPKSIEMHAFCDASQRAYGACVYIKSEDSQGHVEVHLISAKSRVAPIKASTIARLELNGALLAAQLSHAVTQALRCPITRHIHWTDSTIVLGWLKFKTTTSKLKIFVANRVAEILELTDLSSWRHVPTALNPADLVSRGVDPKAVNEIKLWWEGPSFLLKPEHCWPDTQSQQDEITVLPEVKVLSVQTVEEPFLFHRYSNLKVLQRVVAQILRFYNNCKFPNNKINISCPLQVTELENSLKTLIKMAQKTSFNRELLILSKNQPLSSKSSLSSLSPFLDSDGIIRVGGRIAASEYSYDKKHPILLHANHTLTKLIFEHEHVMLMHAGPQHLLTSIRERFWPIGGRNLARRTARLCFICRRVRGRTMNNVMGNLPAERLTPDYPFNVVGLDFAGPFMITDRKGRGCKITKCYLCIFVCFKYKCIHLETVSELSKDAFILGLKRFCGRRGKPRQINCDNGTNFVSACKEINSFLETYKDPIFDFAADEGIEFRFSPAYAPHFGGLWEAGVKSAKFHISRILGKTHLTYEELSSLFTQVEAILNSRPLCPLSPSPDDYSPLTPAHFLIGRPFTSLPAPCLLEHNTNRLDRYERLEQYKQHFWQRWTKEYICELQQRTKWRVKCKDLQLNDLVLLKDDSPPLNWRLGRIEKLFPGSDGIPRVADVATSRGIVRRALNKICLLPTPEDTTDS